MSDLLTRQYADKLRQIYEDRTAGDFTFYGLLVEFALALNGEGRVNVDWLRSQFAVRKVNEILTKDNISLTRLDLAGPDPQGTFISSVLHAAAVGVVQMQAEDAKLFNVPSKPMAVVPDAKVDDPEKPWLRSVQGRSPALFKMMGHNDHNHPFVRYTRDAMVDHCVNKEGLEREDAERMSLAALRLWALGWRGEG